MTVCSNFIAHKSNPYVCADCLWDKTDHKLTEKNRPRIAILATGGTIAGVADDNSQSGTYTAAVLTVESLLRAVPNLSNYADIETEQIDNIDSKDMNFKLWKKLAKRVRMSLASDRFDGIVITHGTDTLEETAYFLYLVVRSKKPVILTAAMRPSNALSADGPLNLKDAVVVAASHESVEQGVLIVMNGQIYSARDVTKTNTYSVDTFRSNEFGALGWVEGVQAKYQRSIIGSHQNTMQDRLIDNDLSELPSVEIVISYTSPSRAAIDEFVKKGVKGIVIAGTGNGTIHHTLEEAAAYAVQQGIAVVRSSRVCYGHVIHDEHDDQMGFLSVGTLNPWKARILLMLILASGITEHALRQQIFNKY